MEGIEADLARSLAWPCCRAQAHDLAVDPFLAALPESTRDVKLLGSLERSARAAGREAEVAGAMRALAGREPAFHGRARGLLGGKRPRSGS